MRGPALGGRLSQEPGLPTCPLVAEPVVGVKTGGLLTSGVRGLNIIGCGSALFICLATGSSRYEVGRLAGS